MSLEQVLKAVDAVEANLSRDRAHVAELSDRLFHLEQKGALIGGEGNMHPAARVTAGAQFAQKLNKSRDLFDSARRISITVETKSFIGAAQVGARTSMGATAGADVPDVSLAGIVKPVPMIGAASLTYARRGLPTVGFSAQPQNGEGAAKQEVTPNFTSITQAAVTVAGYANLSEQALRTDSELSSTIDLFIQNDVMAAVAAVLLQGSTATGATFEGFSALAQALTVPATVPAFLEATIAHAALQMRAAGYQPSVVVVGGSEWGAAVLRADSAGQYVNGSPLVVPPLVIAGLRVAFDATIPAGKAVLIDARFCGWGVSDQMRVDMAYTNDQFTRNLCTVRGEMSIIPFVRDVQAVRLAQRAA